MLFRLISKTALIGSLVSVPITLEVSNQGTKNKDPKEIVISDLSKINDIEIFERIKGCRLIFFEDENPFGVKKLLEKNKNLDEERKSALTEGLIEFSESNCKKGDYLILSESKI